MANRTIMFPRRATGFAMSGAAMLTSSFGSTRRGLRLVEPPVVPPADTLAHARAIVAQVEKELELQAARARSMVAFPEAVARLQIVRDTPLVVARRLFYTFFGRMAS